MVFLCGNDLVVGVVDGIVGYLLWLEWCLWVGDLVVIVGVVGCVLVLYVD